MESMPYPQKFISDRIAKYAALQKLVESGEHFGHAARSLLVMDALVSGQKADYLRLVTNQCDIERLSFETFKSLSDHFYLFRVKPDLRELLEIYIVLDDFSKTHYANDFLKNLPEDQRHPASHEDMLLSLIKYGMIPEVEKLNLSQLDKLRNAIQYRKSILGYQKGKVDKPGVFEYGEDEQRIIFAGVICGIAGIAGCLNLSGSLVLTEETANLLLFLINNRADPVMARRLCGLAV